MTTTVDRHCALPNSLSPWRCVETVTMPDLHIASKCAFQQGHFPRKSAKFNFQIVKCTLKQLEHCHRSAGEVMVPIPACSSTRCMTTGLPVDAVFNREVTWSRGISAADDVNTALNVWSHSVHALDSSPLSELLLQSTAHRQSTAMSLRRYANITYGAS